MARRHCPVIFRVGQAARVEDTSWQCWGSIADSDGCAADETSLRRLSLGDLFAIVQILLDAL
jgi:hypothetical protein